ncbi:MAG: NAD(P)-dependent oxidoreductase [Candidatus Omnitrophota bacterium]
MILITGASGFLGGYLVDEFLKHGFKVRAMARSTSDLTHLKKTNAEIIFADLKNSSELKSALNGISEVIHAAALLGVRGNSQKDFLEVNYEAVKKLADLCVEKKIKRFTFISSIAAVGPIIGKDNLLDENALSSSLSGFYGQSKYKAEEYLLSLGKSVKMEIVILRPGLIYGPNDKRCAANYFRIANLGFFPIPLPADNKASFIYVTDAAKAVFLAHTKSLPNEIYMLANDVATFKEFGQKLLLTRGKKFSFLIPVPRWMVNIIAFAAAFIFILSGKSTSIRGRIKDIGRGNWAVDNSKIKTKLGFVPEVSLTQGLKQSWDFYFQNKEILNVTYLIKSI